MAPRSEGVARGHPWVAGVGVLCPLCQAPGMGRGDPPVMATPWLAHVLLRRWPGPPACPQGHLRATLQDRATCTHCSGTPREAFLCPSAPVGAPWDKEPQGTCPGPPVPNPNALQALPQVAVPRVGARPTSTRGMLRVHQGAGSGPKRGKITKGRLGGSSYPSQTRSPAHPECQERWPGRRSSCRGRGGPDSARGGETRESGCRWHSQHHQRPQTSALFTHCPPSPSQSEGDAASAGTKQHRSRRGPREQRGRRNQTIFPLNLISSFSSTPPQLEVE